MYKDVKINIPMFIGIILLITIATSILVYGVNLTRELMARDNARMEAEFDRIENLLVTQKEASNVENSIDM